MGVDLVEYFGGDRFATAERVVASQLKYSTRAPEKPWTAARLAQAPSAGGASVATRLAQIFAAHVAEYGREETLEKLQIRLVSNQRLAEKTQDASAAAKDVLVQTSGQLRYADLAGQLRAADKAQLDRLYRASGLSSRGFTDFLRVLVLSGTGEDSIQLQATALLQEINRHVLRDAAGARNALYQRIVEEGLPSAVRSDGLTRIELLSVFGVNSITDLLPAPPLFPDLEITIRTADVQAVALAAAAHARVVALSPAGVGKTTTLRLLEKELPAGSVVVIYDCFGSGDYASPSEARHHPQRALLQLINELASRCGTPLVVEPPTEDFDLWRVFERVLADAASSVAASGSRLVVAIDAADNAVAGARQRNEQSFVPDMWQVRVPEGTTILMTSRGHRVLDLEPPPTVKEVSLVGFDEKASARHLRSVFPSASSEQAKRFHERTHGNPRLQFYALADRRPGEPLDALLGRTPETWDKVFESIIDSALVRVENPQLAEEMLATLMAMSRPVEIGRFADAAGVAWSDARRFADGLVPGAEVQRDVIALRDENFVLHLQTRVGPDALAAAHARLATYYFSRHESEAVAAVEVGEQLALAGRDDDLIDLALHGGFPDAIAQPLIRLEVFNRRLKLAIAAAASGGRHTEALELVLLAGDAATSGSAVAALIQHHAELALRFGDVRATIAVYLDDGSAQWKGPLHLRAAAAYARIGDHQAAREQFELGSIEIRNWMRLEADERRHVSIEAADVAAGAEALYWERGGEAAVAWLATWRPPRFAIESGLKALRSLARVQGRDFPAEVTRLSLPDQLLARCLAALWEEGVRGRAEDADAIAKRLVTLRRNWRSEDAWWGVGLAELLAVQGGDSHTIRALLAKFDVEKPSRVSEHPVMWDALRLPLRRAALLAALDGKPLNDDDLLPNELREPDAQTRAQQTQHEEGRRYRTAVRAQAWAYELRARAIVGTASVPHIRAVLAPRLEGLWEGSQRLFPDFDLSFRHWVLPALEAGSLVRGNAGKLLGELSSAAEAAVGNPSTVLLDMADVLLRTARYRAPGLRLLERAVEVDSTMGGAVVDRRDVLIRASELASTVDTDLAGLFYRHAVDLVEGINDERPRILQTFSEFSPVVAPVASSRQVAWLAEALPRLLEQFQPHVSDSDYLPFREVIDATTTLAPAAGFALATRWNDEDRLPVATSLKSVLPASVRAGFIRPDRALKLLVLHGEQEDFATEAIALLDELAVVASRSHLLAAASAVGYAIRRDTSLSQRVADAGALLSWLEHHDLGQIEEAQQLRRLVSFSGPTDSESGVTVSAYRKEDYTQIRRLVGGSQRAKTSEGVVRALDELAEHFASADDVREYLNGISKALPTSQRASFLEILTSLPAGRPMRRYASAITSVLADALVGWSGLQAVDDWRRSGALDHFVLRHLGLLVGSDYSDRQAPLKSLLERELLDDPVTLLFAGASTAVGEAGSQTMYRLAELLAGVLQPDATLTAFEDALRARLDLPVSPPHLPETADRVLAEFFWTLFADVDRRVRWRAAHAARAIASKEPDFVAAVLSRLHGGDPGAFRDHKLTFYEMSARLWLLLTLARIGADDHRALASHQAQLNAIALDSSFPHAAVREFAKRAVRQIGPSRDCELALANQPNACHATRGRRWTTIETADEAKSGRLYFDWDTTRYWFSALAEVFAVSAQTIKERAERWIIDGLGFGTDEIRDDPRLRRSERRFEEMSNYQGVIPARESLHLYLEYHAMLLVAGQLADEGLPVAVEPWDPVTDPWRDWLTRFLDGSPDYWLADLRDPPPLHPLIYRPLAPLERWRVLAERDFERELGLEGESIIVGSSMSIWESDRHGSSWVASAVVTPDTADALRLALDGFEDAHDYALPVAGSHSSDWAVSVAGFKLESWLREARHDREGLEEHDPLRRIERSWQVPDESFKLALNLHPDRHGLSLRDRQGRVLSETVVWNDEVGGNRDYIRNRYTDGWRTTVAWDALLEFLRLTERNLIVKVAIQRQIDRRYGKDVEYDRGQFRNYLIRPDGSIEGLRQRRRTRS